MAGGIFEQYNWPEGRSDYVEVCDGCHTAIWSTRWNEETSDGFDAFLAENGYINDFTAARLHHEIYLSDARKVAPEKWKTVIRHPIKKSVKEHTT